MEQFIELRTGCFILGIAASILSLGIKIVVRRYEKYKDYRKIEIGKKIMGVFIRTAIFGFGSAGLVFLIENLLRSIGEAVTR